MRSGSEFHWILEGYTPDTIPMARLAAYMQQLGKLFGHEPSVHFVRVEKKCVALVSRVDGLASGKVHARVASVKRGDAPRDAMGAYQTMNTMLSEDKGTAFLRQGSATIIRFPGAAAAEAAGAVEIQDIGSVVGYLYMLSEGPSGYHARLRLNAKTMLMCDVSAEMAKKLRDHLFETVKAFGSGRWRRTDEGWSIVSLKITDVEPVEDVSLREALDRIRSLGIEWPDDPLGYLADMNEEGGTIQ